MVIVSKEKEVSDAQKIASFKEEIDRIYDSTVKEFTRLCLTCAPDYIFIDCPSSSSGKYHPIDELTSDGTIIHTKKVFTMAFEMVKALNCEDNRDLVLSACIIHDLRKHGVHDSGHTLSNHAELGADLVDEVQGATQLLSKKQHDIIRNCVGYHYGPWSENKWKKDMSLYTREELCVFISDFTVSKRFVKVDYRRESTIPVD